MRAPELPILAGYDDDRTIVPRRLAWPFVEDSLAVLFGMDESIKSFLVRNTVTPCPSCGGRAVLPDLERSIPDDSSGMYLAALEPLDFGDTGEWAPLFEALGVQYLLSNGSLFQVDEVASCVGVRPIVILNEAAAAAVFRAKVRDWLTKHHGSLSLFRLAARDATAEELATVKELPVCERCGKEVPPMTLGDLTFKPGKGCEGCGGLGWISDSMAFSESRECTVCAASGLSERFARSTVGSWELRSLPGVALKKLLERCGDREGFPIKSFQVVLDGFGDYPAGFRYQWLSSGERFRFHLCTLLLMKVGHLDVRIWRQDSRDDLARDLIARLENYDNRFREIADATSEAEIAGPAAEPVLVPKTALISIRNFDVGPFQNTSVDLPVGKVSCLLGPVGAGKSLILRSGLYSTFPVRKKFSTNVTFPKITSCVYVGGGPKIPAGNSVGSISSSRSVIARLYASTKESRLSGYSVESFTGSREDHQCPSCSGIGRIGPNAECGVCEGTGLAAIVGAVTFGGESIASMLSRQLTIMPSLAWIPPGVSFFCSLASRAGLGHYSLKTHTDDLDEVSTALFGVFGELSRVFRWEDRPGINRGKAGTTLILIDGVFGRIPSSARETINWAIEEFIAAGHTIVCAERSLPVELQSHRPYVVALQTYEPEHAGDALRPPRRSRVM